jgi:hypothetical protein
MTGQTAPGVGHVNQASPVIVEPLEETDRRASMVITAREISGRGLARPDMYEGIQLKGSIVGGGGIIVVRIHSAEKGFRRCAPIICSVVPTIDTIVRQVQTWARPTVGTHAKFQVGYGEGRLVIDDTVALL